MIRLANLIFILAVSINLSFAQNLNYEFESDSKITLIGTSNIHDWSADVKKITGNTSLSFGEAGMIKINDLTIDILVNDLKSSKGAFMDGKMYSALKKDKYPTIKYTLNSSNVGEKTSDGYWLNTVGDLTVSGTTNAVSMKVKATIKPNGNIVFEGSKILKITDFDLEPPTALMGALKTGDEVTVEFKVIISK